MPARCRRPARHEAGFTLIDVLGALLIMSFGLLALANAINFGYRMQFRAFARAREWTVGQTLLDVFRGLPFDCFDPAASPITPGEAVTCGGVSYTFPTVAELLKQSYPGDDYDYSAWTYEVTVTNLNPRDPWQTGDGKITRRLDIRVTHPQLEDKFTLAVVDLENAVP